MERGGWKVHPKHQRWYREFEENGKYWRQWDSLNGPIQPISDPRTPRSVYTVSTQAPHTPLSSDPSSSPSAQLSSPQSPYLGSSPPQTATHWGHDHTTPPYHSPETVKTGTHIHSASSPFKDYNIRDEHAHQGLSNTERDDWQSPSTGRQQTGKGKEALVNQESRWSKDPQRVHPTSGTRTSAFPTSPSGGGNLPQQFDTVTNWGGGNSGENYLTGFGAGATDPLETQPYSTYKVGPYPRQDTMVTPFPQGYTFPTEMSSPDPAHASTPSSVDASHVPAVTNPEHGNYGAGFHQRQPSFPDRDLSVADDVAEMEFGNFIKSAGPEHEEQLDIRYKRRSDPAKYFKVGAVFALLWHEGAGDNGTELSSKGVYRGKFGQKIYSSIRRMVVVKAQNGCSLCLPILTYRKRGTTKPGLDASTHAMIYTPDPGPERLPGEIGMTKRGIMVYPADPSQKLDPLSRINFAKVYTVEHNVRIMPVGQVSEESKHLLVTYWKNEMIK